MFSWKLKIDWSSSNCFFFEQFREIHTIYNSCYWRDHFTAIIFSGKYLVIFFENRFIITLHTTYKTIQFVVFKHYQLKLIPFSIKLASCKACPVIDIGWNNTIHFLWGYMAFVSSFFVEAGLIAIFVILGKCFINDVVN